MGFYNPGFDLESPDLIPESGRFILPLCVDQEQLLLILQTVEEGGIPLGLGRQGPHLTPFWQAFGFIDDPENACGDAVNPPLAPTIIEEVTRTVIKTVYRDNPDLIHEIIGEDDMTRAVWQKFNGIWYAGLPCGDCGGLEWVAQGPGVAIDPSTGAPLAPNDGPGTGTFFTGGNAVSSSNFTCYQDKAVAYMTDRFKQYATYLIDLTWLAGDALLGPVDEVFEGAAILSDIASGTGSANEIRDFTVDEINAAVDATATQDALKAAWTFDGEVNRFDLVGWVNAGAPNVVGNVPLRGFMLYWLANSIIPGYNRDLGTLAAQCEGSDIAPVNPLLLLSYVDSGTTYELYRFEGAIATADTEVLLPVSEGNLVAAVGKYEPDAGSDKPFFLMEHINPGDWVFREKTGFVGSNMQFAGFDTQLSNLGFTDAAAAANDASSGAEPLPIPTNGNLRINSGAGVNGQTRHPGTYDVFALVEPS